MKKYIALGLAVVMAIGSFMSSANAVERVNEPRRISENRRPGPNRPSHRPSPPRRPSPSRHRPNHWGAFGGALLGSAIGNALVQPAPVVVVPAQPVLVCDAWNVCYYVYR